MDCIGICANHLKSMRIAELTTEIISRLTSLVEHHTRVRLSKHRERTSRGRLCDWREEWGQDERSNAGWPIPAHSQEPTKAHASYLFAL